MKSFKFTIKQSAIDVLTGFELNDTDWILIAIQHYFLFVPVFRLWRANAVCAALSIVIDCCCGCSV